MKKLLVTLLTTVLVASMVACGGKDDVNNETTETAGVSTETVSTDNTEETETQVTTETTTEAVGLEGTFGEALAEAFKTFAEANPDATSEDVVAALSPIMENYFGPMVMPVEEGLLTGFDNAEIKGFEEGSTFAPMIGTIPFIGYVFTLPADADSDAFVATLKDNANPRWNICTEADETIIETVGNKVFFVMCPSSFE